MAEEMVITSESTIPETFKKRCAIQPDQEALILGEARLNYGEFYKRVKRMAAVLSE